MFICICLLLLLLCLVSVSVSCKVQSVCAIEVMVAVIAPFETNLAAAAAVSSITGQFPASGKHVSPLEQLGNPIR